MSAGEEDIRERLERVERLLTKVLERLEKLEEWLLSNSNAVEGLEAVAIAAALNVPALQAIRAARAAFQAASILGNVDDIDRAILEALAARGSLSLRELERTVRSLRGSASRSVLKRRIERLRKAGLITVEWTGRAMRISLARARDEEG
ncbi:MAG: helix-turn-helix domain-containing protein [Desulfurococcales archaeon]|nr:helix-turn-helix domain-containing protein [Desulfurococcales archaeon]